MSKIYLYDMKIFPCFFGNKKILIYYNFMHSRKSTNSDFYLIIILLDNFSIFLLNKYNKMTLLYFFDQ